MEDSAIREGFQKLRPGSEYDALYEAAICRERADWIVGINATRLFAAALMVNQSENQFSLTPCIGCTDQEMCIRDRPE